MTTVFIYAQSVMVPACTQIQIQIQTQTQTPENMGEKCNLPTPKCVPRLRMQTRHPI